MKNNIVTNATCDHLSMVHSAPFSVSTPGFQNTAIPYNQDLAQVLAQFPLAATLMGLALVLAILFRPNPVSSDLRIFLSVTWLATSTVIIGLVGSYWLVPKLAESMWRYEKTTWIEPSLSGINEVAATLAKSTDMNSINLWSHFLRKTYDNYTSRIFLQQNQRMTREETHQLLDAVLHTPHIYTRMALNRDILNANERAQLAILAITAQNLASRAFAKGELQDALRFAMQGYEIIGSVNYFEEVVLPIKGQIAHQMLQTKNYGQAVNNVLDIPVSWHDNKFLRLIEATQYALMTDNLSRRDMGRWRDAIDRSEQLQRHYMMATSDGMPSPHIICNIAFLHGTQAIASLQANEPHAALASLKQSKILIPDSRYFKELMPIAHHRVGANQMEQKQYNLAAESFESANILAPRKAYACDAATAWRLSAFDAVKAGNLDDAQISSQNAKALCKNTRADKDLYIEITFHKAIEHMQYGRWDAARENFYKLVLEPKSSSIAYNYLIDLEEAKLRHDKVVNSPHFLQLPQVTGQFCANFVETNGRLFCNGVSLFNGQVEVGRSINNNLSDVIFNTENGYLAVYDSLSNEQYNTWEQHLGGSVFQWIDTDGDYLPDYEQKYTEGKLTSVKQLSGRVSMKFVGGLISKKNVDIFSRPDIFLIAKKNGRYFGRTETVDDSTRPRWGKYFVFDYKYGHTIDIDAVDEDVFSDEPIDHIQIESLPESGYVEMDKKHVTLAVEVEPSTRPEGRYQGEKGESVFNDPAFLSEQTPLAARVRKSYEEDARAQIMATVAAIAIPELGMITLMRQARFAEQFVASWLGFEVTDHVLNKSEEDRKLTIWR